MFQSSKPVKKKLAKFLTAYRNAPHSTTGVNPSQLLLGRPLRTRLDLVKPNLNRKMVNRQHQQSIRAANEKGRQRRQLEVGDSVMSRDYREGIWSGAQGWLSTRHVRWCTRCRWYQGLFRVDISTSWRQRQLRKLLRSLTPTLFRSANPKWPAYHQRQSNWVLHPMLSVQFQRFPWQINRRWFLFPRL